MTNRRDFIRITTIGAGALAISGGLLQAARAFSKPVQGAALKVDLTRTATYCEVCFWKCAGWVYKNAEGKDLEDRWQRRGSALQRAFLSPWYGRCGHVLR